jgi:hypothetical protein
MACQTFPGGRAATTGVSRPLNGSDGLNGGWRRGAAVMMASLLGKRCDLHGRFTVGSWGISRREAAELVAAGAGSVSYLDEFSDDRQRHAHSQAQCGCVVWAYGREQLGQPVVTVAPPVIQ